MWVADTDFVLPRRTGGPSPKRVAHGIFGYSRPSPGSSNSSYPVWPAAMAGPSSPNGSSSCPGGAGPQPRLQGLEPARTRHHHPQNRSTTPSCRHRASTRPPLLTVPVVEEEGRWVLDLEELERQAPRRICCCCATPQPGWHRLHPGRAAGHRRHRRAPQPGDLLRRNPLRPAAGQGCPPHPLWCPEPGAAERPPS